jgi:uncharacterized protein
MKYTEGGLGRVFVLRLEDGDPLNKTLEDFALEKAVSRGVAFYLGGGAGGTDLVVGPDAGRHDAIVPLLHTLEGAHETFAVGTIFPDETGRPSVHMHAACGREGGATVGCARAGLETWLIGELVLIEIVGTGASRVHDPTSGFELLELD